MNNSIALRSIAVAFSLFAAACNGTVDSALWPTDTNTSPPRSDANLTDDALTEVEPTNEPQAAPLAMQPAAPVAWQLSPEESYLSLISIKQTDIAEVHTFNNFNAYIDQMGTAAVAIDMSSIATNADLRDQRLRDHLFEVGLFPQASVKLQLDMLMLDSIQEGEMVKRNVTATLDLHGVTQEITADVTVLKVSQSRITVQTQKPIVLNAANFNMSAGLQTLIQLANLASISTAVPVEFMLSFDSMASN